VPDNRLDEHPGELACPGVALGLGEVPLEDCGSRPLAELGLKERGESQATPCPL
jgi:hypothetical protein